MEKLIKAVKSLLVDIDSMREGASEQFGTFYNFELDSDAVYVDWPNLAISADNVVHALEEYEHGQIIDGELAQSQIRGSKPTLVILDDAEDAAE